MLGSSAFWTSIPLHNPHILLAISRQMCYHRHVEQLSAFTRVINDGPLFSYGGIMTPSQNITLDMGKRSESRRVVYLGQGDSNGTVLMVSLTEGGRPYDATGMTAVMTVPIEGNAINFDGEVNGTTARFAIDESLLGDVNGRFRGAYVTLSGDGFTSSSQRFDVDVLQSFKPAEESDEPTDDPTEPTDDPTCGCTEGSLSEEDINQIWGD